jgi:hypothetical protein
MKKHVLVVSILSFFIVFLIVSSATAVQNVNSKPLMNLIEKKDNVKLQFKKWNNILNIFEYNKNLLSNIKKSINENYTLIGFLRCLFAMIVLPFLMISSLSIGFIFEVLAFFLIILPINLIGFLSVAFHPFQIILYLFFKFYLFFLLFYYW